MLKLLKNTKLYSPEYLGKQDVLIAGEKIVAISDNLDSYAEYANVYDAKGKIVTPGLIDQHMHIIGAGGKTGFSSMTPEVSLSELISCGTTTVVGLLGTDGTARNIRTLYGKVKSLEQEGVSAYMFCGYYGIDTVTITDSIQGDMIFIDKILGCKIAISDIRSSYPTATELLRKLRDVRVGGCIGNKKGILHIHLGNLDTKMDILFELVTKYQFPIEHISPTHVGRTKALFDQAIEFAKLGGMIDITTGASQYTSPYKSVLYALEKGVNIDTMTFSSDGHAGLTKFDEKGNAIGVRQAPIDQNLKEVVQLIQKGGIGIEEAFKLITVNPAKNLGLKTKGRIAVGYDADLCVFDKDFKLHDVFARGQHMMKDTNIIVKGNFE
ncbi:beta-aspartyl-dipeptidase (metallo-type) [Tenacibaculum adriaticum]|uniref:Isoaspartyl dipeptidase n=1 Tax=Tenacibaculum adriaticum TaxID=413713 RepID=A0A5S5DRD2_9FLAO|nr:beta-aspartyl-peptidase [Tenacibaculum adriaticum]TYP97422.1 beta-aspartyl-dipeptidase (metallo-type) [Tenacibaculum adriaticum]